jgi:tetratricopeptide (TPR) repeat protein
VDVAGLEASDPKGSGFAESLLLAPAYPLGHIRLSALDENISRAGFLRRYDVEHLPSDAIVCSKAAGMLLAVDDAKLANEAACKAVALDPNSGPALKMLAHSEFHLNRPVKALQAFEALLLLQGVSPDDWANAIFVAARCDKKDRSQKLWEEASAKYADDEAIYRARGRSLLLFGQPKEALEALRKSDALLLSKHENATTRLLVPLIAAQWLIGDRVGALRDYQYRLLPLDKKYADFEKTKVAGFPEAEGGPLLEVLSELLNVHPEIAPEAQK